jgi:hypothetical protein
MDSSGVLRALISPTRQVLSSQHVTTFVYSRSSFYCEKTTSGMYWSIWNGVNWMTHALIGLGWVGRTMDSDSGNCTSYATRKKSVAHWNRSWKTRLHSTERTSYRIFVNSKVISFFLNVSFFCSLGRQEFASCISSSSSKFSWSRDSSSRRCKFTLRGRVSSKSKQNTISSFCPRHYYCYWPLM